MAPAAPSSGLAHLGRIAQEYARKADEYPAVATDAAVAEAAYRAAKAKAILAAKAERERVSHAEAEARADADDTIADLLLARLTTRALADAHLEKLRQLRSQVDVGRSYASAEREADRLTDQRHP